jgi:hypothetical protein
METAPVSNSSHHQETLNNLNNALDRVLESEPTGTEVTIKATLKAKSKLISKDPGYWREYLQKFKECFKNSQSKSIPIGRG